MNDISYRLELLVSPAGAEFYKSITERSNDNAGFDLYLSESIQTTFHGVSMCPLGCRARMVRCSPDGLEEEVHYWLAPRSSIWKSGVMMANSMGIIDRTYRGPLMGAVLPLARAEGSAVLLEKGVRLFQVLAPDMGWIREVRIVDSLPETTRGEGGFGSTGR